MKKKSNKLKEEKLNNQLNQQIDQLTDQQTKDMTSILRNFVKPDSIQLLCI